MSGGTVSGGTVSGGDVDGSTVDSESRWRVSVDPERCIGSGLCASTAPRSFQLVGNLSRPVKEVTEPDDAVRDAADFCPAEAIEVRDAITAELLAPEQ
jgi:ferredoxin